MSGTEGPDLSAYLEPQSKTATITLRVQAPELATELRERLRGTAAQRGAKQTAIATAAVAYLLANWEQFEKALGPAADTESAADS